MTGYRLTLSQLRDSLICWHFYNALRSWRAGRDYLEISRVTKSLGKRDFFCLSLSLLPSGHDEKHSTFAVFTLAGAEPIKSSATWAAIFLGWLSPSFLALFSCYSALNMISVEANYFLNVSFRSEIYTCESSLPPHAKIFIRGGCHALESIRRWVTAVDLRPMFFEPFKMRVQIVFGFYPRLLPPSALNLHRTIPSPLPRSALNHFEPVLFALMQAHQLAWNASATYPPPPTRPIVFETPRSPNTYQTLRSPPSTLTLSKQRLGCVMHSSTQFAYRAQSHNSPIHHFNIFPRPRVAAIG